MNLPSLQSVHVVVVGDVMLDRYWFGEARRVSQEAPVPVIDVEHVENRPGGAANVALNIVSMGARATLLGAVGDDDEGRTLVRTLEAAGVNCNMLVVPDWSTILKLRVVSQKQQLLRTDFEKPLVADVQQQLLTKLSTHLQGASALVLQDYDKGTLADPSALLRLAVDAGCPVVVDPKHKPFSRYAGCSLIKPNAAEFERAAGPWRDDDELLEKALAITAEHRIGALVITRGGRGSTVVAADGSHRHIPARPVDVYDVTGAGDTTAAALAVTTALGWDPIECALLANVASGIVVGKTGTATVTGPELARALAQDARSDRGILSRSQLADSVARARAQGERVVFTNGCFDILHAGHVAYLEEARSLEQRLRVLAGLAAVDWVLGFEEDTPEPLIDLLRPDVLVKGGDYRIEDVVGADRVRAYGGEVAVLSLVEDCSTSAIVERIQSGD
jgi:D-beta-D-heptose 7-phosphate kinase/D-beta-D-heptose 1-phosphate adenosyltransferase